MPVICNIAGTPCAKPLTGTECAGPTTRRLCVACLAGRYARRVTNDHHLASGRQLWTGPLRPGVTGGTGFQYSLKTDHSFT